MRRVIEGSDRQQSTLFPECLEDWVCEDNPVRVIDVFVRDEGARALFHLYHPLVSCPWALQGSNPTPP
jgi:hypothetical protein